MIIGILKLTAADCIILYLGSGRRRCIGLPFAPTLPLAGGDGVVDAPPILIRSLVDHAWRQASEMRQSGLSAEEFMRRLNRRVEEWLRE